MVDIVLGNAGTQTITASSLGSYVVNAKSDGKSYGEGHILELLAAQAIPSDAGMDVDVARRDCLSRRAAGRPVDRTQPG